MRSRGSHDACACASSHVHALMNALAERCGLWCRCGVPVCCVAAGREHSLFLDEDGRVYSCGCGEGGRLGHGGDHHVHTPMLVEALQGVRIRAVVAGAERSFFIADGGAVYCCGPCQRLTQCIYALVHIMRTHRHASCWSVPEAHTMHATPCMHPLHTVHICMPSMHPPICMPSTHPPICMPSTLPVHCVWLRFRLWARGGGGTES